ncbi:LytR/AlgR family response regulator transcription factor [Halocola ammonii]
MKSIIIEDSRLARSELKNLLSEIPEVEVVAEAANAEEGIEKIAEFEPELIFLDINMPGKNGFEMLEELDELPKVIFTTAYDEYAIKSFEYNALDYLLKPINPERLKKAIKKCVENEPPSQKKDSGEELGEDSRIFIKDGEKCWIVRVGDVRMFEVCGNYSRVHFEKNKPMILKSLNQLEEKLSTKTFFRANRQEIINLNYIKNVEPWFNGRLKLELTEGEEVEVSRRQAIRLRELLSL